MREIPPLEVLKQLRESRLASLVEFAGGELHLAKMLNYHPQTVRDWVKRGCISRDGAERAERHSHIDTLYTVEFLRPGL